MQEVRRLVAEDIAIRTVYKGESKTIAMPPHATTDDLMREAALVWGLANGTVASLIVKGMLVPAGEELSHSVFALPTNRHALVMPKLVAADQALAPRAYPDLHHLDVAATEHVQGKVVPTHTTGEASALSWDVDAALEALSGTGDDATNAAAEGAASVAREPHAAWDADHVKQQLAALRDEQAKARLLLEELSAARRALSEELSEAMQQLQPAMQQLHAATEQAVGAATHLTAAQPVRVAALPLASSGLPRACPRLLDAVARR